MPLPLEEPPPLEDPPLEDPLADCPPPPEDELEEPCELAIFMSACWTALEMAWDIFGDEMIFSIVASRAF